LKVYQTDFIYFAAMWLDKMACKQTHIPKMSNENVNTVQVNYIIQKHSLEISQGM